MTQDPRHDRPQDGYSGGDRHPDRDATARLVNHPRAGVRDRARRGFFLLPNLITSAALFAGFYGMVASTNGHYIAAGMAIIAAMVLDTMDGRVARFTGTQSEFGAQYDSLSDMAAFGVAPALLVFSFTLSDLGNLGWAVTFIYMACAALRLARFNTDSDLKSFTGLASPAAAAILATSVWILHESDPLAGNELVVRYGLAILTLAVGLLMVSPFRYLSPKAVDLRRRVPFVALVGIVLTFAVVLAEPPRVLLVLFAVYAASGPISAVFRYWRRRRRKEPNRALGD